MTETGTRSGWLAANGEFLAASVAWLRELLLQNAQGQHAQARPTAAAEAGHRLGALAAAAQDAAARCVPPPALVALAQRTGLSRFEQDVLLLCAATELDPSIRALCAGVHGHDALAYPTFALALTVLPDPAWEALSPDGALRDQRLIEIDRARGESLISSPLRTDERIVNHLKGLDHLDVRLHPLLRPAPAADEHLLPASHLLAVAPVAGCLAGGPPAQLVGPDRSSAMLVASAAATRAGVQLFVMPGSVLPASPDEIDDLARLWHREWALSPVALCVEVDPAGRDADAAAALVTRLTTPVLVRAREAVPALDGHGMVIDIDPPTMAERHAAWQQHLPAASAADPGTLAAQFTLDTATIAAAAADPDPWARCRVLTRPHLGGYAQRVTPKAGWADLVLGEQELRLLHDIANQVRNRWRVYQEWGFAETTSRGLGLSVLLSGPSGVGKTLATEVLARELDVDLYRTDLSAVVSKYIGETEKNLRQLFDAAEASGALLLFDEADALFGKRTEVREAHDRFANIQIDYLLQRMEAYHGLAVLSTNMRSALDPAFLRRLRFIVEFPFPDTAQRRAIWALAFPAPVPGAAGLDLDRLAELPVTGGMIRNIAMNAAFLAAGGGRDLDMACVLAAVKDEFAKLQLPIRQRDLTRLAVPA
jgi:ATPase family associated with various cellular activities (AAA)